MHMELSYHYKMVEAEDWKKFKEKWEQFLSNMCITVIYVYRYHLLNASSQPDTF